MARVVFKKLDTKSRASRKHVGVKRLRNESGQINVVSVVDATSRTLPNDLGYVFRKNVAKARKDNRQRLGASDLVPGNA
jgi:hypothetical protein